MPNQVVPKVANFIAKIFFKILLLFYFIYFFLVKENSEMCLDYFCPVYIASHEFICQAVEVSCNNPLSNLCRQLGQGKGQLWNSIWQACYIDINLQNK